MKTKPQRFDPEEIFLDSSNLPSFNRQQFEGELEKPIKKPTFFVLGIFFALIGLVFTGKIVDLQIVDGKELATHSRDNTLRFSPVYAERGVILDRMGKELAWNDMGRKYITTPGFGHILGYIGYPTAEELASSESDGKRYGPQELIGRDGAERVFQDTIHGTSGVKIEEVDVAGNVKTDYLYSEPVNGNDVTLAIDARVQGELYKGINSLVSDGRFKAGAGVIMDIHTGELLALTSVPEYDPNALVGKDRDKISGYLTDPRRPFLNRATMGLYTPGSIVKPFMALAALNEHVIDENKKILSTGSISVPNPFFPDKPSVFKDWKAHGWVDMRRAIAVSSDVYFYTVGGGFGSQAGMGISNIDKYATLFGLGRPTGIDLPPEKQGVIPTPEWKAKNFDGEIWRVGDTYNTVIGQYGFQVTPIQMVRAVAAIASGGRLFHPTIIATQDQPSTFELIEGVTPESYQVVREGMRLGVLEGTASGLNVPYVQIAGKTGTAELGVSKQRVNSWAEGFFPYESPRYAFAVVMEEGSVTNTVGAVYAMRQTLDALSTLTPEYFAVYN